LFLSDCLIILILVNCFAFYFIIFKIHIILTKQLYSLLQAMKCQLVTAIGAICGTLVSLTFGKDSKFVQTLNNFIFLSYK